MSDRWDELAENHIDVHVRVERGRDGVWRATVWRDLPYDAHYSGDVVDEVIPGTPGAHGPTASASVKSLMRTLGVES